VASPHAGDWLNVTPISSLGLKLEDSQLKIAASLRLGTEICHPHTCVCGVDVTPDGTHGLHCKKSAGRFPRHHQANDLIKRALSSAGFPSVLEPPGICREDGKRPDGMTLFQYSRGKCLVWDFTCRDTLAPSHLSRSKSEAGRVAIEAETEKISKCQTLTFSLR